MTPNLVRVEQLPPEGETFEVRLDAAAAAALLGPGGLPEGTAVEALGASVRVLPGGRDVFVLGTLDGRVVVPCARCLEPCREELRGEFHLTFVRGDGGAAGGEVELHREDLDLEVLRGGEIDLGEVVVEQLLLNLPAHPLCDEACRGLCPGCGGNRNRQTCDCADTAPDPRFAALAGLLKDRGGSGSE